MNKRLSVFTMICCFFLFVQLDAKGGKGLGKGQGKGRYKPVWTPTEWQKSLPPITVEEKGRKKEYKFVDLIKADGYLCPGSARSYKTLQVALNMLFKGALPAKGDFKITYGPSDCETRVFKYFMSGFTSQKYLELNELMKGRVILISRISTGERVKITYDSSAESKGHNAEAARVGDIILHATDGDGMKIERG